MRPADAATTAAAGILFPRDPESSNLSDDGARFRFRLAGMTGIGHS
jgi:hypothetical protein